MPLTAFGGEDAESFYDEGLTAAVKGDLDRAAQFFEKAIRLDTTMATAYHQLGKCYARLGRYKKAIALLSQVVDKRPDLVAARLDLGHALNGIGEFGGAQRQFLETLKAEPANFKALIGLAESEALQGRWPEALTYAKSAQETGGANFPVLYMLGEAAKHAGESDLSVKSLQKADKLIEKYLETSPDKPDGHYLRGKIAALMENYPSALQHFREAEAHAEAGRSYLAYGESFTLADVLARQAECLERLGRTPYLRELRDRIAELDPEHPALKTAAEG